MELPFDPATLSGAFFLCLCGICTVLVHVLPRATETSASWYGLLMRLVNLGAGNFGKAANSEPASIASVNNQPLTR